MRRLLAFLFTTRLTVLLFLVPPAAMWARTDGSGGFLLPTVLALLACAHFALFDAKTLGAGKRRRLALTRNNAPGSGEASSLWATYCIALLALCVLVLLFVSPRVGLFFLVISAIALPLTGGVGVGATRRRMLLSELADPFAFLVLPAWWIASTPVVIEAVDAEGSATFVTETAGLVQRAGTVTWLCALTFGVYLLACQLRDAGEDTSDGQVTTPTLLGQRTAGVLLLLMLAVLQLFAANAVTDQGGGFSMLVPAVVAIGGMTTLYAIATNADDAAPTLALLTQALLIIAISL